MIAIVAVPILAVSLSVPDDAQVLAQYRASLERYATLRADAVAALPERQLCGGPEQLEIDQALLADEIRRARPVAREGDVFTPAVAKLLRLRLHAATGETVLLPDDGFGPDPDWRRFQRVEVNESFRWEFDRPRVRTLFVTLPALPVELEYRLHGGDLVLLDVEADLVVDVLRDALR